MFTVNQEGVCPVTLDPPSIEAVKSGTAHTPFPVAISVTADASCPWTATTSQSWITLGNASGTGNGVVGYQIEENNTGAPRDGVVTVNGQAHTIHQLAEEDCTTELSPTSIAAPGAGGRYALSYFTTNTGAVCSGRQLPSWITIYDSMDSFNTTPGRATTYSGVVYIEIAPNPTGSPRTGMVDIDGTVASVTQSAGGGDTFSTAGNWILTEIDRNVGWGEVRPPYTLSLSQTGSQGSGAGVGNVSCVTVTGVDGVDDVDGKIRISVSGADCDPSGGTDIYEGQISDGIITGNIVSASVPGQPFVWIGTFTLVREECVFTMSDGNGPLPENPELTFPAEGGNGGFTASTFNPNCNPTSSTEAPWISWFAQTVILIDGSGGRAHGYWIGENESPDPRTGVIHVGDQTFSIVQPGRTALPAGNSLIATTYQLYGEGDFFGEIQDVTHPLAQAFVTGDEAQTLEAVRVKVCNFNGTDPSTIRLEVWADDNGNPVGPPLEILDPLTTTDANSPVYTIGASGDTVLSANTQYWLVMQQVSGAVQWMQSFPNAVIQPLPETTGAAPAERRISADDGATWTPLSSTFVFNFGVIGGPVISRPTALVVDTVADELDTPATDGSGKISLREAMRDIANGDGTFDAGDSRLFGRDANLTLRNLKLTRGYAGEGGAILVTMNLTLEDVILEKNLSDRYGGALRVQGSGKIVATRCLFRDNRGGALRTVNGSIKLIHCTVVGNSATHPGGGIDHGNGTVTIENCIVSGNSSPGGQDIDGDYTANGFNLVGIHMNGTVTNPENVLSTDPMLAPLGDYGGPSMSMPPLYGSPAIDAAIPLTDPLTTDQRSFARPVDGDGMGGTQPDIGAVEAGFQAPMVTWNDPAGIVFGNALSEAQLNATADVPGAFVYSPAAGTTLNAGDAQTLSVVFTPDDLVNYKPVSAQVTIDVAKAMPVITWSNPADIVVGTALSEAQLNAMADLEGSFVYTPPAGTVLSAGSGQTLMASFTPTDTVNHASASAMVVINVIRPPHLVVDTTVDELDTPATDGSGKISLREAMRDIANGGTITFDASLAGQTLRLTRGQLDAGAEVSSVIVDGVGLAEPVSISGDANGDGEFDTGDSQLFGGNFNLTLRNLKLTHGYAHSGDSGGVIFVNKTLILEDVTFENNRSDRYGGALRVNNSGKVVATRCLFRDNISAGGGGAVANFQQFTAVNCTFTGNRTTGNRAGAIWAFNGPMTLIHCTVAGNSAASPGGGITQDGGPVTIENCIVSGNSSPGGQDIDGDYTANGFNLVGIHMNGVVTNPENVLSTDPMLAPLGDYGGPTMSMPPLYGSPAIDAAIPLTEPLTTDQRSFARPVDGDGMGGPQPDIGAVEAVFQAPMVTWNDPAGIVFGVALSATQLNATADVAGSFVYSPPAGTFLNIGDDQTLNVTFTPDDQVHYQTIAASVLIDVAPLTRHLQLPDRQSPLLVDGQLHLGIFAEPNVMYTLYGSGDLIEWIPIQSKSDPSGLISFTDPNAGDQNHRFYRVLETPPQQ